MPLLLVAVLLAAVFVGGDSSPRTPSAPPSSTSKVERPITVIGDSHARGIAAVLREMFPAREIRNLAVGGSASWQMPTAPDDGSIVIVSAGTVDCGAKDPATTNAIDSIDRVLGPFLSGADQGGGRLFYLEPHDRIAGMYAWANPRIRVLRRQFEAQGPFGSRFGYAPLAGDPGPDGLHLTLDGYRANAAAALAFLEGP